jgi:prophage tail gpP-like protein
MSVAELRIAGAVFSRWTGIEITRDLAQIAGGFQLEYLDDGRAIQAIPQQMLPPPFFRIVRAGMACTIWLDGEKVLDGYIDDVDIKWGAKGLQARIQGRDKTGDLVDCAALPEGPAEFRNVDLLHVAQAVCAPFGVTVQAEADIGEAFERLSVNPHETALAFLEKAARQRAILLVSDGVGGLLLTRGGTRAGPERLVAGGNVQDAGYHASWRQRFSDVYVKGQTDAHHRRSGQAAALTPASTPLGADLAPDSETEASTIIMTGHARDPEITRYRPLVRLTRTQSGMSTTQEQAEWYLRVARGMAEGLAYTMLGWRAGEVDPKSNLKRLWRPNEVVSVVDPYADLDKPMLIAGVVYSRSAEGTLTRLRVVGRTAFDRINESEKRRHRVKAPAKPLDSTVVPLGQAATP